MHSRTRPHTGMTDGCTLRLRILLGESRTICIKLRRKIRMHMPWLSYLENEKQIRILWLFRKREEGTWDCAEAIVVAASIAFTAGLGRVQVGSTIMFSASHKPGVTAYRPRRPRQTQFAVPGAHVKRIKPRNSLYSPRRKHFCTLRMPRATARLNVQSFVTAVNRVL